MGKILIIKGADFSEVAVGTVSPVNPGTPVITISESGSVTITCDGVTNIYYTTNGDTPTTASTKYTSAFTVSSGTTVKAIAEFADGSTSGVVSKTYLSDVWVNNTYTWDAGGISGLGTSSGKINATMSMISPLPKTSTTLRVKAINGYYIHALMLSNDGTSQVSYIEYSKSEGAYKSEIDVPAKKYFQIALIKSTDGITPSGTADIADGPGSLLIKQ